jgi:hypothetical protein
LENLEASVKNFKLSDLFRDYFAYCDANFRDKDDDFSLSEFIKLKYSTKMDNCGSVLNNALEMFEELMTIINPIPPNKNAG